MKRITLSALLAGVIFVFLVGALVWVFSSEDTSLEIVKNETVPARVIDPLPLVLRSSSPEYGTITVKGDPMTVEVSKTAATRKRGLSGRASLGEQTGMLFVFESSGLHGFWMKDMKFAIDIIWLDERGVVVDIAKHATPESYPTVFTPDAPSHYVLEVVSGKSDTMGLTVGDRVDLKTLY